MQGGFSFCGVDIMDLGLEYVPELQNTYVYAGSSYKVHEQSFDEHDGGYFYGTTVQPKHFTLRCIFQDSHINEGILTAVERFFARGKSGRLVFKKRPWVYYVATVTAIEVGSITNYLNGIVTIQMKAYYPFGRCDDLYYDESSEHLQNIVSNSNMLPRSIGVPTTCILDGNSLTGQTELYLYNGGTERAKVAIEMAGDVGEGVTIANVTTGQKCSFVAQSKAITTDLGQYIVSDGLNGRTQQTNGVESTDASLYHDYGFIDLEPDTIQTKQNIFVADPSGYVSTVESGGKLPEGSIGKRIYIDGAWRNIIAWKDLSHTSVLVSPAPTNNVAEQAPIVSMNKIVVTPAADMDLTRLNFVYKPTFK